MILGTFWGMAICVVGFILLLFMLRSPQANRPTYRLQTGEITALKLFPAAQEAALAWEGDVQFVSASAVWRHASLATLEQPAEWLYRFYSPGLQRILFVIITPDREIIVRPHLEKVRHESRLVDPAQWRMDSAEAVSDWLNHGGGDWLAHTIDNIVSAQLTLDLPTNTPVWTISGLNPATGESVLHTVNAAEP